jgi:hypothetical protein
MLRSLTIARILHKPVCDFGNANSEALTEFGGSISKRRISGTTCRPLIFLFLATDLEHVQSISSRAFHDGTQVGVPFVRLRSRSARASASCWSRIFYLQPHWVRSPCSTSYIVRYRLTHPKSTDQSGHVGTRPREAATRIPRRFSETRKGIPEQGGEPSSLGSSRGFCGCIPFDQGTGEHCCHQTPVVVMSPLYRFFPVVSVVCSWDGLSVCKRR